MNGIESNSLFNKLSAKEKEVVCHISKISLDLIRESSFELNDLSFEINSDAEDWWYSYVNVVSCSAEETQGLNEKYIDRLVCASYLDDVETKIIFRFESATDNAQHKNFIKL